jgi:hypothetical protein
MRACRPGQEPVVHVFVDTKCLVKVNLFLSRIPSDLYLMTPRNVEVEPRVIIGRSDDVSASTRSITTVNP